MIEFEVNVEADFINKIKSFKKDLEKTTQNVLRKTALQVEKEIHRVVTSNNLMDITMPEFRKTKTIVRKSDLRSGIDQMNVKITISGMPHTSYRFKPRMIVTSEKKVWAGMIYGKLRKFYGGKAFAIDGLKPLFARKGKGRYPLKAVFGPSVTAMLEKENHLPGIYYFTEEKLKENLLKLIGSDLDLKI